MKFRVLLLFLLTSLVAASPLWERAVKGGKKTTKKVDDTKTTSKVEPTKASSKPAEATSVIVSSTSKPSSSIKASSSSVSVKPSSAASSKASSSQAVSSKAPSSSAAATSNASSGTTKAPSGSATQSASSSASKSGSASSGITSAASSANSASASGSITSKASSSASSSSGSGSSSIISSSSTRNSTASATSSGVSSSASASSTKYICGASCGKKGCALNPSGTAKASSAPKPKTSKRAEVESLARRTLKDVSAAEADKYVLSTIDAIGSTKGLDYAFSNDFAVSRHAAFANKPVTDFVTGLEGCTGVAVVSEKGYWISHFMEDAYVTGHEAKWANLWKAVKSGNTKYTRPDTLKDLFGEGTNPQIYLMRPRDAETNEILYNKQTADIMGEIQQGILKGLKVTKLEYKKPKDEAELNKAFETTARGKMLIEYDNNQKVADKTASPQKAIARVFLQNEPKAPQEWTARENQLEGAADAEKPVEAPAHKPTCLADATKTLSEADITAAFDSVFKTGVDFSSPVSQTGTSGDVKVQFDLKFSDKQDGCKVSGAKKTIMKTMAKRMFLEVAKQCPKAGSSTEFMGVKPDVHNSALGCLDVNVYRV